MPNEKISIDVYRAFKITSTAKILAPKLHLRLMYGGAGVSKNYGPILSPHTTFDMDHLEVGWLLEAAYKTLGVN